MVVVYHRRAQKKELKVALVTETGTKLIPLDGKEERRDIDRTASLRSVYIAIQLTWFGKTPWTGGRIQGRSAMVIVGAGVVNGSRLLHSITLKASNGHWERGICWSWEWDIEKAVLLTGSELSCGADLLVLVLRWEQKQ